MRVKPEKVLEQDGVAAHGGIKEAQMEHAFETGEKKRDGYDGSAKNHDQTGGVMRPGEEREAEPGHAGGAHGVDGDNEIEPGENRGEAVDENTEDGGGNRGI